jgi:hypothetical protein
MATARGSVGVQLALSDEAATHHDDQRTIMADRGEPARHIIVVTRPKYGGG